MSSSHRCPHLTGNLETAFSSSHQLASDYGLTSESEPDTPAPSSPASLSPGHMDSLLLPPSFQGLWKKSLPTGEALHEQRQLERGLVWDGTWLIFPLNKHILLIGLLRQCDTRPDLQHAANKLCEELNHVSIPKACRRGDEKISQS